MDAQTRHQLKTNELGEVLVKARLFMERRGWTIVMVVAAVALVVVGVVFWSANRRQALDNAWQRLFEVHADPDGNPDNALQQLRDIASEASDEHLAATARYRLGCLLVSLADRDAPKRDERLSQAVETLKQVADGSAAPDQLRASAEFALGGAYENQRDFTKAKSTYQSVAANERYAGSPFQSLAASRAAAVDQLKTPVKFEPGHSPPPPMPEMSPTSGPSSSAAPPEMIEPPDGMETPDPSQPAEPPGDSNP